MADGARSWRLSIEPTETGLEWLQSALGLDDEIHIVARCGGGIGASTHLLRSGDVRFVVKQYRPDRAKVVEREWGGLQLARAHDLPVPDPLAVDIDGSDAGLPTVVMSFDPGEPDLRARDPESFVAEVADLLAKIHRIDIAQTSTALRVAESPQRWEPPDPLPDGLVPPDLIGAVVTRIVDLAAGAGFEDAVLNHGDFHPGNLLWRGRRVSALLDWSYVQVGTRAAELAYFRIELALLAGWPAAEMLRERYQEHADVSPEHQMLRDLLHVYACHRGAHSWLEGWHAQGRADLTLADVRTRLTETARILLAG